MMASIIVSKGNVGGLISELEGKGYQLNSVSLTTNYTLSFSTDQTDIATVKSDLETAVANAGLIMYGYEVIE